MTKASDLLGPDMIVLPTEDPLRCSPEEKPAIETANCLAQLDFIEYLVAELGVREIRESHVLELHKLAVQNIFDCGGQYRT